MTDIQLSVTPEKNQSFIGTLTPTVVAVSDLANIIILTDGSSSLRLEDFQKVVYDDDFLYMAFGNRSKINYIIKISNDFTTLHQKQLDEGASSTLRYPTINFIDAAKTQLVYAGEGAGTMFTDIFDVLDGVYHLHDSTDQFQNKWWGAYIYYPRSAVLDSSGNIIFYGYSASTASYNYLKYNSSRSYQSMRNIPTQDIRCAIYENSALHCIGRDGTSPGIYKINTTTDAVSAFYSVSKATYTIVPDKIFYDSNDKFYITSISNDGSSKYYGHIMQISQDLTTKNYDKFFSIAGGDLTFTGCCEYDGYIFATGYTPNVSGGNDGIIVKLSMTDLSLVDTVIMKDLTNSYIVPTNLATVGTELVIYANLKDVSANITPSIIKIIGSNIASLKGAIDSTSRFSFSDISLTETDAATTYASASKSATTPVGSSIIGNNNYTTAVEPITTTTASIPLTEITLTLTPASTATQGEAPNTITQSFALTTDVKCSVNSIVFTNSDITIESGYDAGEVNVPFELDVAPDSKNIVLTVDPTNFSTDEIQIKTTISDSTASNSFDFIGYVSKSFSRSVAKKILSQDKV